MYKLIFKTPSFDLMEDVKKRFGVEFHPNTPITKIGETNTYGKGTVKQVEEATREEKKLSLEIKPDKISS